jgi:oligosaccharide repeat unit polymerase
MAYKAGMLLSPSVYFQSDESIRPIYNFMLVFSTVIVQILIARVFIYNKLIDKVILGVYLALSLFIGARSAIILPIMELYTFNIFFKNKGKINIFKMVVLGAFMLFFILYLSAVRSGDPSIENTLAGMAIATFYGNSFSDLRDFAWVLGSWNGVYLHGKTYLAAFMSFIPSGLSTFRTQWSIGKVTAVMAGFDPLEHPGLRPGLFGESFLNFGLPGVIFLGLILGYIYRYIDFHIKKAADDNTPIIAFSALISGLFILNLPITSGFFNFYCTILILLFLFSIRLMAYYLNTSAKVN